MARLEAPAHLVRGLEAHVAADAQALERYALLAAVAADNQERLLLDAIVANKHRSLDLLRAAIEGQPAHAPRMLTDDVVASQAVVVRGLIRHERACARSLRELAHEESPLSALLLELLARESEAHAHVLSVLLNRLYEA